MSFVSPRDGLFFSAASRMWLTLLHERKPGCDQTKKCLCNFTPYKVFKMRSIYIRMMLKYIFSRSMWNQRPVGQHIPAIRLRSVWATCNISYLVNLSNAARSLNLEIPHRLAKVRSGCRELADICVLNQNRRQKAPALVFVYMPPLKNSDVSVKKIKTPCKISLDGEHFASSSESDLLNRICSDCSGRFRHQQKTGCLPNCKTTPLNLREKHIPGDIN